MAKLGVNVDHVATLRQARGGAEPDPVTAAIICEKAGCHSIVAHLREDRRHINDEDVNKLRKSVKTMFNLEMSTNESIVKRAIGVRPDQCTLVPEKRQELTTEGGLNVIANMQSVSEVVSRFYSSGIKVSLFIDPEKEQIEASKKTGAGIIEIHTGRYANAVGQKEMEHELSAIFNAVKFAIGLDLKVNAGHGLNYENVKPIRDIKEILNWRAV